MPQSKKLCKEHQLKIAERSPSKASRVLYGLCDQLKTFGTDGKIESLRDADAEHILKGEQEKKSPILNCRSTKDKTMF